MSDTDLTAAPPSAPPGAARKITVEELGRLMADLTVPEEDLARYFEVDEEASTPTRPKLRLNPETVEVPPDTPEGRARSAAVLNGANFIARLRREARYQQIVAGGQYRGPLIAAEGDSWFQYPFRLKDVIDWTFESYAVYCRSEAGDTLENMVRRGEYLDALERTGGRILLLSGGGNDLVAGGNLAQHLRAFNPALQPAQYLLPSFGGVLDGAIRCIETIVRSAGRAFPACRVICHGYDYAIPKNGNWLGRPMASRGITDAKLQKAIAREMVDRLNTRLINLANQTPRIAFVDLRGTVGDGRWFDELHPTDEGYGRVTRKIVAKIAALTPATREAPGLPDGDSATDRLRARRRARSATPPAAAATARGYSLHIGLNKVDPGHYEGWDGPLAACEFDADDMANLAATVGYEPKILKTAEATREAVIGEIRAAAERMKPGDIFFLTYSGHGSQVPDFSGDERLERPEDAVDETLCLFDGQVVDDELYVLWSAFPADSRVLAVFDCCHSGSAVKSQLIDEMIATATTPDQVPRVIPRAVAARVARKHQAFYRAISEQVTATWAGPVTREMALPVSASVRLISACQDNQVALDGLTNGLFTGKLLETWGAGAFQGNYEAFHKAIADLMPPSQTPNHYTTGLGSPSFDAQRPFDI
jgi:hypothetical protein